MDILGRVLLLLPRQLVNLPMVIRKLTFALPLLSAQEFPLCAYKLYPINPLDYPCKVHIITAIFLEKLHCNNMLETL